MREIDLQTWARRNVYGLFSDCDWPFYQVSFPLDVTNLRAYTKKEGLSFYFTLSWLLTKGMEQQEAFLIRIREGRLFVLDELMPSCTVLRPGEEAFRIISLPAGENPADFCRRAGALAQTQTALYDEKTEGRDDLIYFSCLPWLPVLSLTNERHVDPDDCIPRVGWGKYQDAERHGSYSQSVSRSTTKPSTGCTSGGSTSIFRTPSTICKLQKASGLRRMLSFL